MAITDYGNLLWLYPVALRGPQRAGYRSEADLASQKRRWQTRLNGSCNLLWWASAALQNMMCEASLHSSGKMQGYW